MPEWKPEIRRRLAPLKLSPTREEEIAEEIAQHLDDQYQELVTAGSPTDSAFRVTLDQLKNEELLTSNLRSVESDLYCKPGGLGSSNLLGGVLQDIRYVFRMISKSPGFTAVAVLTLALGIGANTAIFSVINGVLLNPLPYKNPNQLVAVKEHDSLPNVMEIQRQVRAFSQGGGINVEPMDYTGGAEPVQVRVGLVNAGFLETLGVQPMLGRIISPGEDVHGGPPHGYHLFSRPRGLRI